MGFVGPERDGLLEQLGVELTSAATWRATTHWMTNVPGVFAAGDMQRGQSLIVWAIAEGRCARPAVDDVPDGRDRCCPAPIAPDDVPISACLSTRRGRRTVYAVNTECFLGDDAAMCTRCGRTRSSRSSPTAA